MQIIAKIWLLFGWFYLSLASAVIFFYISKKFRRNLGSLTIICAAVLVLVFTSQDLLKKPGLARLFFRPIDEKIESTTLGQASYALHLREILAIDARGCIYWSFDLATLYLQKELYPRVFSVMTEDAAIGKCEYIISQFVPRNNSRLQLLDSFQNNYLYRVKY